MSCITAFTDSHQAAIVVDSEAFLADASIEAAKIHLMPSLGAAFAVRGTLGAGLSLYQSILGTTITQDELIERMPELMAAALAYADSLLEADAEMRGRLEIVLAAWSHERERMTLHHFKIIDGQTQANRFIDNALCPGEGVPLDGITATLDGMLELAERQVLHLRGVHPTCAAGGRFIVCELTRDTLNLKTMPGIPARTVRPGSPYVPDERLMQQAINEAYGKAKS